MIQDSHISKPLSMLRLQLSAQFINYIFRDMENSGMCLKSIPFCGPHSPTLYSMIYTLHVVCGLISSVPVSTSNSDTLTCIYMVQTILNSRAHHISPITIFTSWSLDGKIASVMLGGICWEICSFYLWLHSESLCNSQQKTCIASWNRCLLC